MHSGLLLSCGVGDNALRLSDCHKMSMVQTFHGHSSQVLHGCDLAGQELVCFRVEKMELWNYGTYTLVTNQLPRSLSLTIISLTTHDSHLRSLFHYCRIMLPNGLFRQQALCASELFSFQQWVSLDTILPLWVMATVRVVKCVWQTLVFSCGTLSAAIVTVIQYRWHQSGSLIATTGADKTAVCGDCAE